MGTRPPAGLEKNEAKRRTEQLYEELEELQELMYGAGRHGLLIVMQGLDAAGKDGGINNLGRGLDALGVKVVSFKQPTPEELAHDFLWRVHRGVPGKGEVAIFNRSHYEDVGVVRVHNLVDEQVWRPRFDHINAFEALLAEANIIVLKFWLHVSPEEQRQRLLEREQSPAKAWKLNPGDWAEREFTGALWEAYSEAINRCSAPHAPWYIVPTDAKWYRDLYIATALVEALRGYAEQWRESLRELGTTQRAALDRWRAEHPDAK